MRRYSSAPLTRAVELRDRTARVQFNLREPLHLQNRDHEEAEWKGNFSQLTRQQADEHAPHFYTRGVTSAVAPLRQ
jgi:hypothetical protein